MILHQRTHPVYVEGCYACRIATVSVSADATPNRRHVTASTNAMYRRWDRDMPAYKRLRENGVQPRGIDGSAKLEKGARTVGEIEYGSVLSEKVTKQVGEILGEETKWS